jgi:hypothetical protein
MWLVARRTCSSSLAVTGRANASDTVIVLLIAQPPKPTIIMHMEAGHIRSVVDSADEHEPLRAIFTSSRTCRGSMLLTHHAGVVH